MKAMAWFERGAPRDLFDLEGLARVASVSSAARNLIGELLGYFLTSEMLSRQISGLWHEELAHQTRLEISEVECLAHLLEWWEGNSSEA